MAAPTWPPTPEDAARLTMEEYGLSARDLGLQTDEEVEQALLAPFLFGSPERASSHGAQVGTPLAQVHRRLGAWLRMVSGLDFELTEAELPTTDGQRLYLPHAAPAPAEPEADERLFRCMGLVQLGLVQLGLLGNRALLGELYRDWVLRGVVHLLAARAALAQIRRALPGVAADLDEVGRSAKAGALRVNLTAVPGRGLPAAFAPLLRGLAPDEGWGRGAPAEVEDAVRAVDAAEGWVVARLVVLGRARGLRELYRRLRLGAPPIPLWLGALRPEWVLADLARDLAAETAWMKGTSRPLAQLQQAIAERKAGGLRQTARGLRALAGQLIEPRAEPDAPPAGPPRPEDDGGRDWDEWDGAAGHYRLAAARVYCPEAPAGPLAAYQRVLTANARSVDQIRRRFAALRAEDRWVSGLREGSDIDLDRAVTAMSDVAAGQQPRDDLYRAYVRRERDLCVLTLVDLSGSTQGRVLALEQEAVVLFAEGLRTLGLPHAFYGFSSEGARACNLWRLKDFSEGYEERTLRRLGNLRAGGGTRLGALLRQAGWMLSQRPQRRRVLLVLSDGRPEDRDGYRGTHGVQDSAVAARELRSQGVQLWCLSLDGAEEAETYLAAIFGAGRFLRVPDVESLPARLPEMFRGLV